MSLLIIHLILMSKFLVSCRTPCSSPVMSSKAAGFGEDLEESSLGSCWHSWPDPVEKGTDIRINSCGTPSYPPSYVESQEAWPGSGLDVPAEDNSIQCSMARPGKWVLAGTACKLSSGPFQQALIGEASLIVRNSFSCCLMVSLYIWQFF